MLALALAAQISCWAALPTGEATPLAARNLLGFDVRGAKTLILPQPASGGWPTGRWHLLRTSDGFEVAVGAYPNPSAWNGMGSDQFVPIVLPESLGLGEYVLVDTPAATGKRLSKPFEVKNSAYRELAKALIKGFYFWRASSPITAPYGGAWTRVAGHPDDNVTVYDQNGRKVSAPRGWYDAGDYGIYVVNAGVSTWTLGQVADLLPAHIDTLSWNIPPDDSVPALPDLLSELKWETDWLLGMQDTDGGVWNKLTTWKHAGFVMPDKDVAERFMLPKSTDATFQFIAVVAQQARHLRSLAPAYSARCSTAAEKAWAWTVKNPSVYFPQTLVRTVNGRPDTLGTGWYDVTSAAGLTQPRFLAAQEMSRLTGKDAYFSNADKAVWLSGFATWGPPDWTNDGALGMYAMALDPQAYPASLSNLAQAARTNVIRLADSQKVSIASNGYRVPLNNRSFYWGSNGALANKGVVLMQAWRLTSDSSYLRAAQNVLDYLLGRNPVGKSFVTGFPAVTASDTVHRYPTHIHDRRSDQDGVAEPVPGYLSGGANSSGGDPVDVVYKNGAKPALSWIDSTRSYASNEIAINWNAPLFHLALQLDEAYSRSVSSAVGPVRRAIRPGLRQEGNRILVGPGDAATVKFLGPSGRELSRAVVPAGTGVRSLRIPGELRGLGIAAMEDGSVLRVISAR